LNTRMRFARNTPAWRGRNIQKRATQKRVAKKPAAIRLFAIAGLVVAVSALSFAEGGTVASAKTRIGNTSSALTVRAVKAHLRTGSSIKLLGRNSAAAAVSVKYRRNGHGRWHYGAKISASAHGRFSWRLRVSRPGSYVVATTAGRETRIRHFFVYVASQASWYGPGLYGHRTACGQTLTAHIMGVANKTLPCGTIVKFRYGNRTALARVIDRGPYAAGRTWDLTAAVKSKLRFPSTGAVLSTR